MQTAVTIQEFLRRDFEIILCEKKSGSVWHTNMGIFRLCCVAREKKMSLMSKRKRCAMYLCEQILKVRRAEIAGPWRFQKPFEKGIT